MNTPVDFVAVDMGSSNVRLFLCRWNGVRFWLEEVHRFDNAPVELMDSLYWDMLRIWSEIKIGLARCAAESKFSLTSIGVESWGIDFGLLDAAGELLNHPHCYRDRRTEGMPELVFAQVPLRQIFERTGLMFWQINTLYHLYSMKQADDPRLEIAHTYLMTPDLVNFWLTGERCAEFTIATTTQFFNWRARDWDRDLLARLGIPTHFLPPIIEPGTVVGSVREAVAREVGFAQPVRVVAPGGHDTACAVAGVPDMDAHSAFISSGTWSILGIEVDQPVLSDEAFRLGFTNEGGVGGKYLFIKNITGLWLLQEARRQWSREGVDFDWQTLVTLAEAAPPFAVLIEPDAPEFLSPSDMLAALRAYCARTGQPLPDGQGAVVRCFLESLALKYRWAVEALERASRRQVQSLRVVGGGSQNRLLCRYTADATRRVVYAGPVEATAFGNVMMQAIAAGHLASIDLGRQVVAASVQVDRYAPELHADWAGAYDRFRALMALEERG